MKILVTGATGFIGGSFLDSASRAGRDDLRAALRRSSLPLATPVESTVVEGLTESADWRAAIRGCDAVVHSAARVHVINDVTHDPLAEFRRANVAGTLRLAHQSAAAGIRRFVFLSSIKVNGERTTPGRPFAANDSPAPVDAYGVSKHEAEQGLQRIGRETGMEVVIIRPVLAYGPGVRGNFLTMLRWLRRGIPLPFGAVNNRRSFVAIENLVDLIGLSLRHPAAAGHTFLVSDGEDLSTPDLLRRTATALGRHARLFPVSERLIEVGARITGRAALVQRLCGSLQVDIAKTRELLDWNPPVKVNDALLTTARYFMQCSAV